MSAIPTNLNEILNISSTNAAQKLRTLAVFDLDSTLFNVSTRSQKILDEFADLHHLNHLKNVEIKIEDWGLKEALIRAGYKPDDELQLLKDLKHYWSERFFSNEYLHYDVPYLGAISFVQDLSDTGCEIYYLTGRDQKRMQQGTIEVLYKWGFPLKLDNLFLKPERSIDDEIFKLEWFRNLNHAQFQNIFFFENEPVNINAIVQYCPEVEVIFLDTTHSRKEQISSPLKKIKNFNRS